MKTLEAMLTEWMRDVFKGLYPEVGDLSRIGVVATTDSAFGDYQCNAAMALAKTLRCKPVDLARRVLEAVMESPPAFLLKIEVAGPGFLNLHLSTAWLADGVSEQMREAHLGVPRVGEGHCVIIDYSSPNVAKPMHIGHIRSTVIGNALDRMYRYLGYRVIADNHIGDWGTQFGILIMGYRHFLDTEALSSSPVEELERLYVRSYEKSRESEEWLNQARQELVKLQSGDPENRRLWKEFIDLSLAEFQKIYGRLGVHFDLVRGESYYNDRLPETVERLRSSGLARESEGALVAFLDDDKLPPCIVQKSDGAFNYAATDIATVMSRVGEFSPDRIIYVTDERQQLHFKQVFAICRHQNIAVHLEHVWFGLMRLPEGTFSTRQGNVIKLERLLDEAEARALELVKVSSPDMDSQRQIDVARAVGLGAVKYADLSQNPQSLVTFSWDKALSMTGNSAPYLQYACARIGSLCDKYRERFPDKKPDQFPIRLEQPVERELALMVARFPEAVVRAADTYKPSILADYLFSLAGAYSSFYQNVPVLKSEDGIRESRLRLGAMVERILRKGLDLLGIEAPDRI